ncbi:MAG: class I SAM-dependent RNA methyltransferase [Aestuariivirga sp.]
MATDKFEIMLVCTPGLEKILAAEAAEQRFALAGTKVGGVLLNGTWKDVWRANLNLRGAGAVLARIGTFRVSHLSELDKRARKFPWRDFILRGTSVKVTASCHASRVYHSGAVKARIESALAEEAGMVISEDALLEVMVRIDKEQCTISLNTSGAALHKRGHKKAVGKAPMRETMAALFLRQCGFKGDEPVLDPMCGSGTFILEAAEIASGLAPGRDRQFAFEQLNDFDPKTWDELKATPKSSKVNVSFYGSDRNAGAIASAIANAERAGVSALVHFHQSAISNLQRPAGPPGLVIVNPPYGGRIGDPKKLRDLYSVFGGLMMEKFSGWRVGLITNEEPLARATKLPFSNVSETILHGGLRIRIYQTSVLS